MEKQNTNFRLSEDVRNELKEFYGSHAAGLELHIPGMLKLRQYTLHEVKGLFTKAELTALVDAQNGTLLVVDYLPNVGVMAAHMEDFEKYENGISRHGATPKALLDKLHKLTSAQVYWLQDDINVFWEQQSGKKNALQDFIKKYSN